MGFVASLVVGLLFMVVGELLRPKVSPPDAVASGLDDFNFPTASETRNWTWIAGKVLVEGGNVTWYGDLHATAVKKKVKTGLWSSKRVTIAHKYSLGLEMFLSVGAIEDVHEVRFGGEMPKIYTKTSDANTVTFNFNDPGFFGGDEKDGGVVGTMRISKGTLTQSPNSYMQTVLGRARSAYRGLCFAVFENLYIGTRENMKPVSFVLSRYPNALAVAGGKHKIGEDSNPVCMIYELLTDRRWAAAIPSGEIDLVNFRSIADRLHAEGMGMSQIVNTERSARDAIAEILRHIDGVMYSDPETGLLTLAIARDDYDIETLPVFDENNLSSCKCSRGSWATTKNTLKISYVDREQDYSPRSFPIRENGNILVRNGEIASESIDFFGFMSGEIALKRGTTALKTISYPLLTGKVVANGSAWKLRPGSVFKLNWPMQNIQSVVMRVVRINYGGMIRNRIEMDCVEDIFAISSSAYAVPPPSNWENPLGDPQPLVAQAAFEAPYGLIPDPGRYIISVGSRFSGIDVGYETWHDPAGGTAYVRAGESLEFTPTGVLSIPYAYNTGAVDAVGFTISSPRDISGVPSATQEEYAAGDSLVLIESAAGQEFIAWKTKIDNGDGTYTFKNNIRGVYDTTPIDHPAGARVWLISEGMELVSETSYGSSPSVRLKLLPWNVRGVLPIASASGLLVPMLNRASRPYPPGKLRFNAAEFPAALSGAVTMVWEARNRLTQLGVPVSGDATGIAAEVGTLYAIRIYNDTTNALIIEKTGINANVAVFGLTFTGRVRVEVSSSVGSLESYYARKVTFDYSPGDQTANVITADTTENVYVLDGGAP